MKYITPLKNVPAMAKVTDFDLSPDDETLPYIEFEEEKTEGENEPAGKN